MELSTDPTTEIAPKLAQLRAIFDQLASAVVCFSGGIDSTLLLAVANEQLGARALGLTAVSASLAPGEREEASELAQQLGAAHVFVSSDEVDNPAYIANAPDRCFHCKTELYSIARREADERGFAHVVSGIITDDLGDFRPGIEAARQRQVRFPLVEAGFRKQDVRRAAALLGLPTWDKPAAACLSSRIPYGTAVTRERLAMVGGLEATLKQLGFRQLRVRYHETTSANASVVFARIELGLDELPRAVAAGVRRAIAEAGRAHGFDYITLDLLGYRMGSHNEVLRNRRLPVVP